MNGLFRRKKVRGKKKEMKMIGMENFDARNVITFQGPKSNWKTMRESTGK